ncbi:MAG: ATP-binding protein [Acidobacteriota bacterium]|nr:ATP-binding protein [Acidobacteriota bacterium]
MRSPAPRRLIAASVFLGLFVLFDLGLLGWFIFRSLSQKEVERILLEARAEARGLAGQLSERLSREDDLFTAIAKEREIQTYIDAVLKQRNFVQEVEIRDRDGRLVFRSHNLAELPVDVGRIPSIEPREIPAGIETQTTTREETFELNEPIGDLGFVHIGLSQGELQKRIGVLRSELIRQTSLIGAVTLVVLLLAYLIIWWLWRRSRGLEAKAAEAERLAYIGTLASGLAHEIRNPLNSLSLNMQLLEEEPAIQRVSGSMRRLLTLTRSEIGRLEHLVTDFLQYARPRPLELTETSARDLLRSCQELMSTDLDRRGADLLVEDRSAGALVCVDPGQLTQLLLNLVQNALGATEESERPPEIRLIARREGADVLLEVLDNGVGIPSERMENIFDLFYSTRKGGTGLGLAVVKRIADNHGGEVRVQSTPGVGTRVQLLLPECGSGFADGQEPVRVSSEESDGPAGAVYPPAKAS